MSIHAQIAAYLEEGTEEVRRKREVEAKPTTYAGVTFRSKLEAQWAYTLDYYGIRWEYEPETVTLPSGARYLPDFRLPDLATVIEAKGPHMQRLDKTREYARQVHPQVITLIGYPPQQRKMTPYAWQDFMQWGEPLGFTALFTTCLECGAYQWCRPRFSVACRKCGQRFTGHFAGCGEMRFTSLPPGKPAFFLRAKSGGALYAMVPR